MYWPKKEYSGKKKIKKQFKFDIGDTVRTSMLQDKFTRSYDSGWSDQIYKVNLRYKRQGEPIYKIIDWFDEPIEGGYYESELLKVENVNNNNLFKIENIVQYRYQGNKKEALISWKGWPKRFNSWILASEIEDV